jgi:membrane protein required for beta-lactamase induction
MELCTLDLHVRAKTYQVQAIKNWQTPMSESMQTSSVKKKVLGDLLPYVALQHIDLFCFLTKLKAVKALISYCVLWLPVLYCEK